MTEAIGLSILAKLKHEGWHIDDDVIIIRHGRYFASTPALRTACNDYHRRN